MTDKIIKITLFTILIIVILFLYWTRYQTVEVHNPDMVGFYKINRLTGNTTIYILHKEMDTEPEK